MIAAAMPVYSAYGDGGVMGELDGDKDPLGDGVKLKPFNVAPKHATLLNTGRPVDFAVNLTPADHQEQEAYLRLMHLPTNEMANTVLVVKLQFDRDLEQLVQSSAGPDQFTEWQK